MNFLNIVKSLSMAGFMALAACGGEPNLVQKVQVSSYQINDSQYLSLSTLIDSNQIIIPGAQFQIPNSKNPAVPYGNVQILPNLPGGSELRIDLNLSALITDRPLEQLGTLPNGLPIPVSGFNPQTALSVSISEGTRLYLDLDTNVPRAFLGLSLGIKEFSTGVVGGLFLPFQQQNGIRGVTGIFTGPGTYQSGFALFIDVSSELMKLKTAEQIATPILASISSSSLSAISQQKSSSANYISNLTSERSYKLHTMKYRQQDVQRSVQRQLMRNRPVTLE